MAYSSIERKKTELVCNACGCEFKDYALYEAIESDEGGIIGWVLSQNATEGISCPSCGSPLINVK